MNRQLAMVIGIYIIVMTAGLAGLIFAIDYLIGEEISLLNAKFQAWLRT